MLDAAPELGVTENSERVTPDLDRKKRVISREAILKHGTADYDEDLRKAPKLSVKEEHQTQELQNTETKELEEAMKLSF